MKHVINARTLLLVIYGEMSNISCSVVFTCEETTKCRQCIVTDFLSILFVHYLNQLCLRPSMAWARIKSMTNNKTNHMSYRGVGRGGGGGGQGWPAPQ